MSVYKHFGVSLPRTASAQAKVGKGVAYKNAKAGDIIYQSGHVGIYVGNGKMVHASGVSKGITVSKVSSVGKVLSVRRIVE